MSVFSDAELAYLAKGKLGRLATIDATGMPHIVLLGWQYNPALDVIDIGPGMRGNVYVAGRTLPRFIGVAWSMAAGLAWVRQARMGGFG